MANVTYTVKKGDTLTAIAKTYGTTVSKLVELNHIANPDYIVVGQVLIISGTASTPAANNTSRPVIEHFGLQSNTDRTIYATWRWDKKNTDHYETKWTYYTGDGVAFVGNQSDVNVKQSLYSAPANAVSVAFYVRPISKTYKSNNRDVHYWTAGWSTVKRYYFKDSPPSTPPVPTVKIEDYILTAELSNLDVNAKEIQFQIVKNDSSIFNTGKATIKTTHVSYSCTVKAGAEYKVRCRAVRGTLYSDWTEYSDNVGTAPSAPNMIIRLRSISETSVYIDWSKVSNATSYEIEYTTKKRYFDSSSETKKMTVDSIVGHAEVTGLDTGEEWFFRVRAVNDKGNSPWTDIKSIKIGTAPSPPTTWSSTTTVMSGGELVLYWVHNSEDGSNQTYAELELIINGVRKTYGVKNSTSDSEKDKTSSYVVDTSEYTEGTKIQWRVRTRGIIDKFSDWSVQRTIDVYAPPTLELNITTSSGTEIDILQSYPFYISGEAGPDTQIPIGYHLSITSNEIYETVDSVGNPKMVNDGEEVYSKYFDISGKLIVEMSASNLNLENNISYKITCVVSMNSGLTTEMSKDIVVAWPDDENWPNAEISYDNETYSTSIRPFSVNEYGEVINDTLLSVYRREFNGEFTELGKNIDNASDTFITDPHPSLDFARYRIISTSKLTGRINYYDIPGFPIGESAVIIQWDEKWTNFDISNEDALEQPPWSGSLLRLPYNIDVSEKYDVDVELVEYIGKKHPVSYYGTQQGISATWNVEIEASDKETLYALRRLAIWTGDVYVREPSGIGYWANIKVSIPQKHLGLTIPITFEIKRVSGGV